MAIVVVAIGVIVNIEKEEAGGLKRQKTLILSLWPMKNPKPNDRWMDTATGIWYVWLGDAWEEDAWEGGS